MANLVNIAAIVKNRLNMIVRFMMIPLNYACQLLK